MAAVFPSAAPSRNPTPALEDVLRHPGIWRRSSNAVQTLRTQATGNAALDALLPGGGWPFGALTEILLEGDGLGELGLLMPALSALTRRKRRVAMIAPPYLPFPQAWMAAGMDMDHLVQIEATVGDSHWSAEQCLRAGCCAAVLHWLPETDYRQLRRLQLAAETGSALAFLFRPLSSANQSSPAALRLSITHTETGTCINVLKCRGSMDAPRGGPLGLRA